MGIFLNVLIAHNAKTDETKRALSRCAASNPDWELKLADCRWQECGSGVEVLLSDYCLGYEDIPKAVSKELMRPVMMCYIYDGDFWGYFLYDNGVEADVYNPVPNYFDEVSDEERQRLCGNSGKIAQYFHVEESRIKRYLVPWEEESEVSRKAYPGDNCAAGGDWQMADFMNALGYPYAW